MSSIPDRTSGRRALVAAVLAGFFAAGVAAPVLAQAKKPVGFISSVRGKPTITADGKTAPAGALQAVAAGSTVVLQANELVDLCHETSATAFRLEGAGRIDVGEAGLSGATTGLKISATGRCGRSAAPSVPGGVLLRSIKVPPKTN
jgi:hypothetical protein